MASKEEAMDSGDKMDIDVAISESQVQAQNQNQASKMVLTKTKLSRGHELTTKTIKAPPFSYACLELISSLPPTNPTTATLDALTTRTHLTSALTQFLGLTGSAISLDILKIEGTKAWIRVPREDLAPLLAAAGGWVGKGVGSGVGSGVGEQERVGWRVRGSGNWLSSLVAQVEEERVWRD